ncbi:MAG: N-acetylmuramic acid 6-phosphate etherase [Firmicutes bacterium]|uniref:N-acetylmuramic acid 6-phosphate etherase n=1 Tax=Melghirimyces thermohalophilus TaxID=1236220 RepID=A0A1G6M6N5_9BACL|nr:N-acetylmuramic acid 6-phosphate etherase [Melghirimyces thermohalophilus]MDA8352001.1 N-acetylmuramic acid 6-phosphate etherase [Bacillota bacterium]SDC51133.1 N-acetylmuramic acid 6-phosphate etherase [Melghirimyces thermohalophilus]
MDPELSSLKTEQINEKTVHLDCMDTLEILRTMNREDQSVPLAVSRVLPQVAAAVDRMEQTLRRGGRIFYTGAGTSGRLGVLDASECPPTFSTSPEQVQGLIAGGDRAIRFAVEGAEDAPDQGATDLEAAGFQGKDFLVGLSASGRTPYVLGALGRAQKLGAESAAVTANPGSAIGREATIAIEVDTGPEVLTGSTRLKAGTAQKLILNMLSTATMVRLGKTYRNLMVDLQPTNEKLRNRARRIVKLATGVSDQEAHTALQECGDETKTAIVMILTRCDADSARQRLSHAGGRVGDALFHSE